MTQGYAKTSTRKIAQAVGITQPNLYHYYPNKEKLYQAVLEEILTSIGNQLNEILNHEALSFEESLFQMTHIIIDIEDMDYHLMHSDLHQQVSDEMRHQLYISWQDHMLHPFICIFKRIIQEKSLKQNANFLGRLYFNQLSAAIEMKWEKDNDTFARSFIQFFLHGVKGQVFE